MRWELIFENCWQRSQIPSTWICMRKVMKNLETLWQGWWPIRITSPRVILIIVTRIKLRWQGSPLLRWFLLLWPGSQDYSKGDKDHLSSGDHCYCDQDYATNRMITQGSPLLGHSSSLNQHLCHLQVTKPDMSIAEWVCEFMSEWQTHSLTCESESVCWLLYICAILAICNQSHCAAIKSAM